MKTYWLLALGCDKNIIDAEVMAHYLISSGYVPVDDPDGADVLIVHTCGFITPAIEESIDAILGAAEHKGPSTKLVVSGCLAQRYGRELADEIEEIDLLVGVGRHGEITGLIESTDRIAVSAPEAGVYDSTRRIPSTPPYYAFVKVSEGCDNRCAYCTIPDIRGRHISRRPEDIVREIQFLEEGGLFELNLIAQDLAAYGRDLPDGSGLPGLLRTIMDETTVPWIRLLYLHPASIRDELITLMATSERLIDYLDMPIQHISDRILSSMGRKLDRAGHHDLIQRLRKAMPDLILRTTVMVGYPGEGESEFTELLDYIEEVRFDRLGAFVYSPEPETRAGKLGPMVPEEEGQRRFDILMETQRKISRSHLSGYIGKELSVLVCGAYADPPDLYVGRFFGQAPDIDGQVLFTGEGCELGDLVRVRITDSDDYDLTGIVVEDTLDI
ncbi:MAG: 30S ribosomal protein S12 methylthiotransferase RimO [Deltaproteobacteria bacterium]|nr:30S ribosomal protein S12 methylthiotransferase RimO [Candidatus Zymogenaceae bacterium]